MRPSFAGRIARRAAGRDRRDGGGSRLLVDSTGLLVNLTSNRRTRAAGRDRRDGGGAAGAAAGQGARGPAPHPRGGHVLLIMIIIKYVTCIIKLCNVIDINILLLVLLFITFTIYWLYIYIRRPSRPLVSPRPGVCVCVTPSRRRPSQCRAENARACRLRDAAAAPRAGRCFRFEGAHRLRPACRHRCDAMRRRSQAQGEGPLRLRLGCLNRVPYLGKGT